MSIEEHWLEDVISNGLSRGSSLAIDVGANRGSWTGLLAKHCARVIAIEPDDRASSSIDRSLGNVEIISAAASSRDGKAVMHFRDSPDQNSFLKVHPIGGGGCREVPVVESREVECVTLDSVAPDGADFVKIDVEGFEAEVLKGCSHGDRWSRTFFVVECHDTLLEVHDALVSLGKDVSVVNHPYAGAHPNHCWAIGAPK